VRHSEPSTDSSTKLALIIKDLMTELGKVRVAIEESKSADAVISEKLRELKDRVGVVYRVVVTGNGGHALVTDVELLKAEISEIREERTQGRRAARMFWLGVVAQILMIGGLLVTVILSHGK
jgi:hypothetical protein